MDQDTTRRARSLETVTVPVTIFVFAVAWASAMTAADAGFMRLFGEQMDLTTVAIGLLTTSAIFSYVFDLRTGEAFGGPSVAVAERAMRAGLMICVAIAVTLAAISSAAIIQRRYGIEPPQGLDLVGFIALVATLISYRLEGTGSPKRDTRAASGDSTNASTAPSAQANDTAQMTPSAAALPMRLVRISIVSMAALFFALLVAQVAVLVYAPSYLDRVNSNLGKVTFFTICTLLLAWLVVSSVRPPEADRALGLLFRIVATIALALFVLLAASLALQNYYGTLVVAFVFVGGLMPSVWRRTEIGSLSLSRMVLIGFAAAYVAYFIVTNVEELSRLAVRAPFVWLFVGSVVMTMLLYRSRAG